MAWIWFTIFFDKQIHLFWKFSHNILVMVFVHPQKVKGILFTVKIIWIFHVGYFW